MNNTNNEQKQERLYTSVNTNVNTNKKNVAINKSRQGAKDLMNDIGFAPVVSSRNSTENPQGPQLTPNRAPKIPVPVIGPITFINATLWRHNLGHYHISFTLNHKGGDRADQQLGNMSAKSGRFRDFARNVIAKDEWYADVKHNMTALKEELQYKLGSECESMSVNRIMVPNSYGSGRNVYLHTGVLLAVTTKGDAIARLYINDQRWDLMFTDTPTEKQIAKGAVGSWEFRRSQANET